MFIAVPVAALIFRLRGIDPLTAATDKLWRIDAVNKASLAATVSVLVSSAPADALRGLPQNSSSPSTRTASGNSR